MRIKGQKEILGKTIVDGRTKHPYYSNYRSMLKRCYSADSTGYKYYGGKGIAVCEEWLDPETGFWTYVKDVGRRPHPSYTIDRIRSDLNYSPKNVRWANIRTQNIRKNGGFTDNTHIQKSYRSKNPYRVRIVKGHKGKHIDLFDKCFATKKEAIIARDKAYKRLNLKYQKVVRNYSHR